MVVETSPVPDATATDPTTTTTDPTTTTTTTTAATTTPDQPPAKDPAAATSPTPADPSPTTTTIAPAPQDAAPSAPTTEPTTTNGTNGTPTATAAEEQEQASSAPPPKPASASATDDGNPIFLQEEGKPDMSGQAIFDLSSRYVFNRENHKIYIRIHQLVFDKVLDDGASEVDSGYGLVDEFVLDDVAIANVGIKVRGNTSRANLKRQFKFKFDATKVFAWRDGGIKDIELPAEQDDRRFYGEQGFSIRASQNDPSKIRELLSGKVFREAQTGDEDPQRPWRSDGGLVYRSAFATLYVTNGRTVEEGYDAGNPGYRVPFQGRLYDPKGLYVVTENIDKTFIKTRFERFPNEKVKCYLFQADKGMAWFLRDKYTREGWKLELAKGKNAKDEEDFQKGEDKMMELIDFLASNPTEDAIRETFDMDSVNGYLAGALLTTHWDSLAANRNNDFVMYWKRDVLDADMKPVMDAATGKEKEEEKWYLITWDLDNTLWDEYGDGSDVRNPYRKWFSNYIYQPAKQEDRKARLFDVVFGEEQKTLRGEYDEVLRGLLSGYYETKEYEKTVDGLSGRVREAIEDTKKEVSQAGWQTHWGESYREQDYVDIKEHAQTRRHKIGSQLD